MTPGGELHFDGFKALFTGSLPLPKNIIPAPHSEQTVTTQAMILAAGFATRLEPIAGDYTNYCKPALPLNQNESVILAMAKHLISFGITRLIINTSFIPHSVKQALSELPEHIELFYIDEETPSGTAGGLFKAFQKDFVKPDEPILIVQGDAVSNFDLGYLLNTHTQHQPLVTIGAQTVKSEDVHKFGIIKTQAFLPDSDDPTGVIQQFKEKPSLLEAGDCRFANTGFYVLSPEVFETFISIGQTALSHGLYDFAKDFFPKILKTSQLDPTHPAMIACRLEGYWTDIGNPLQYYQTLRETCPIQAALPPGVIQLN